MEEPIKKKVVSKRQQVKEYVDSETGEVLSTSVTRHSVELFVSNDDFFFTYSSILKVTKGTTPLEGLLLQTMCFACEFNRNVVNVSSSLRKQWCKKFNCTAQSLANAIQGLKKKKLIFDVIEGERGSYLINPVYMFKGDQKSRSEAYELMLKITTTINENAK